MAVPAQAPIEVSSAAGQWDDATPRASTVAEWFLQWDGADSPRITSAARISQLSGATPAGLLRSVNDV